MYAFRKSPENVRGDYQNYDLVFSGHFHYSQIFSKFNKTEDSVRRNKHAAMFINPGSVGQPRNHNPAAQCILIDRLLNMSFRAVSYDIEKGMELYCGQADVFYRDRLEHGV